MKSRCYLYFINKRLHETRYSFFIAELLNEINTKCEIKCHILHFELGKTRKNLELRCHLDICIIMFR